MAERWTYQVVPDHEISSPVPSEGLSSLDALRKRLEQLGSDGWELVVVVPELGGPSSANWVFKRGA